MKPAAACIGRSRARAAIRRPRSTRPPDALPPASARCCRTRPRPVLRAWHIIAISPRPYRCRAHASACAVAFPNGAGVPRRPPRPR
ncbi:hypothetical protein C7S14_0692 [Burkholderia cepacia]|nr:hypothetical protein C7S14_0692 [Burkholderia cepacia]